MESLLEKIQRLEEEAQQIIDAAKAKRELAVQQIQNEAKAAATRARHQAEEKARATIAEAVQKAKHEAGELIEQEQALIKNIHATAATNRARAINQLLDLFAERYL